SPCAARLPAGIQSHSGLAYPYQQRSYCRGQMHGSMGDACSRLKHDAGNRANRDVGAYAGLVDDDKGTVQYVDLAILDKDHGHTVFHGQWLQWREQGATHVSYSERAVTVPRTRSVRAFDEWQACSAAVSARLVVALRR